MEIFLPELHNIDMNKYPPKLDNKIENIIYNLTEGIDCNVLVANDNKNIFLLRVLNSDDYCTYDIEELERYIKVFTELIKDNKLQYITDNFDNLID